MAELIPCPTCDLPADLLAPTIPGDFPHSRCAKGHDNALVPAVLSHLRSLDNAEGGWERSHGKSGFDRCGQPDVHGEDP